MKLWLLTQSETTGYDTYDSIIVAAETRIDAATILPRDYMTWEDKTWPTWATDPSRVDITLIGVAAQSIKRGVILASFNAG